MAATASYLGSTGSDKTGIRKYLNDQGYKDDQIGYSNGNVSLNGKSFMNATPEADGSTYASAGALQNALKQYNSADTASKANNLNNTQYNSVTSTPFQFKQQQAAFSYDPNSDQAYQAALKSAQQNIQTGQNNTLANLLAHGQGNSSYAATAAQQVANKEMNNVSNNILPSLIQQAYTRYKDQNATDYQNQLANYNSQQDQFKNQSALSSYFNGLGQQEFTNERALNQESSQNKQANLGALQTAASLTGQVPVDGPKDDWRLLFQGDNATQFNPTLPGQQFQQNVQQQEFENKMKTQLQNANLSNMSADNARQWASEARQAGSQKYAQLFDTWDRTGQAPAGLESLGIQAGTPLRDKSSASATKVDPKESANNYNTILGDLTSDGVSKEQAMSLAQANSSNLSDADYRKLLDYINKSF